jgi:hypothetical protein
LSAKNWNPEDCFSPGASGIQDPFFENPTVLLLVDRNELEAQLFGNLESVGFGHVEVAQTKEHLRRLLKSDRRGLIVSMIHKFDGMPANINTRSNVFVLVDEAHRTTGGDLGNYLLGALPNATLLGFTGTPIDKTAQGKGTFKVFGFEDEKGYLDKYSIRESIQDGTTVPLHYALAPNELRVDRETLEKEFLGLASAAGVSDIEDLNQILEQAVTLRNMLKNRDRVKKVAAYMAKHFRENVEPMGYKAFLVGVDREACCLYKEALDQHLPPEYSRVVISQAGKKDAERLKRHYLGEIGAAAAIPDMEVRLLELLRDPSDAVRGSAASALGQMGAAAATPDTLGRLLELLRDQSGDVGASAAYALGQMGAAAATPDTLARLVELLRDKSHEVLRRAAYALGQMGAVAATPDTLARLVELIRDPSDFVRLPAAYALGQMGAAAATPDTLARLLELLRDPSEDVRVRAASALGQMGARAVDEHTVKMLAEFWSGLLEDVTSRTFPEGFMRVCDKAYKELQKLASRQGATGAAE